MMCEKCFESSPDLHLLAILKIMALIGCAGVPVTHNGKTVRILAPEALSEASSRLIRIAAQNQEIADRHPLETALSNSQAEQLVKKIVIAGLDDLSDSALEKLLNQILGEEGHGK